MGGKKVAEENENSRRWKEEGLVTEVRGRREKERPERGPKKVPDSQCKQASQHPCARKKLLC